MTLADLRRCLALVEEAQELYDDNHVDGPEPGQCYSFRALRSGLVRELEKMEEAKLREYQRVSK